ncbi:MAG: methyltransferase domain-containing protein [Gallionellaceae bacterium]|nr:methyltransferase domain-containing protein [Gallionellaceae bacterium]
MSELEPVTESFGYASATHWSRVAEVVGSLSSPLSVTLARSVADQVVGKLKCESVLDIATGDGGLAFELATQGAKVVGIDYSDVAIRQACKRSRQDMSLATKFAVMNASYLSFADSSFDAVTFLRSYWVFPEIAPVLREVNRVLKRQGKLVIQLWGSPAQCSMITFGTAILGKYLPELHVPSGVNGPFDITVKDLSEYLGECSFQNFSARHHMIEVEIRNIDDYWLNFRTLAGTAYFAFTQQSQVTQKAVEAEWHNRWHARLLRGAPPRLRLDWLICTAQKP